MTQPRAIATSMLLVVLGCIFLTGCASGSKKRQLQAYSMVHDLPLQSSSAQVVAYLDSRKIEHTPYRPGQSKDSSLTAILRYDPSTWELVYTSYSITFRFDATDHLVSSEVKQHLTGP